MNEWLGVFQGDASSTLHEGETTAATLREGARSFISDAIANFEDGASAGYGKGMISEEKGTTFGVGYGIPTTKDGEVTNSPASSWFGELQSYTQYEREMNEKAEEVEANRGAKGGSGAGGGGAPGDQQKQPTNVVAHEQKHPDGSTSTFYQGADGRLTVVRTYPDGLQEVWTAGTTKFYRDDKEVDPNEPQSGEAEPEEPDAETSNHPESEPVAGGFFEDLIPTPRSSDFKPWTGGGDIDPPDESSGDGATEIDDGTVAFPGKLDLIGQPGTPDSQTYLAPPSGEEPTLGPDPNEIDPGDEPSGQRQMGSDEPGTAPGTIGSKAESELESPVAAQESSSVSEPPEIPEPRDLDMEDLNQIADPTAEPSDFDPFDDAVVGS